MARRVVWLCLPLCVVLVGCLPDDRNNLVPGNPFNVSPTPPVTQVSYAPASNEAATRVALTGQKLLQASPQLELRPLFRTVGAPQAEVFHRGALEIVITEGLVKQCTEGQLAAILAEELGKMASDRVAQAPSPTRLHANEPPPSMFIGSDNVSSRGPADLTYQAELARYDNPRRQQAATPPPPPNPQALALAMLLKAGYSEADRAAAAPLLKAAGENMILERQFNAPATPPTTVR
jgi:hypothetical protein